MTGVGGDTGRGVRVAARGLRTWRLLVERAIVLSFVSALIAGSWKAWSASSGHDRHVVSVYALSEFLLFAGYGPDKSKILRVPDGRVIVTRIGDIVAFEPILVLRDRVLDEFTNAAMLGGGIGAGIAVAGLVVLRTFGGGLRRGRRLRGGELVSARQLSRRARPWYRNVRPLARKRKAPPCRIAGIPWPGGAETRHTIVSGTTGSGKTVLIADLVEQIRARGERCVLYDKMGSYTEAFFDAERDVLLNPLDARAPRWSPFVEARSVRDFDTMAAALIPRQKDAADPFWITAARQLFSHGTAVLWKRGETHNRVLVDHLLKTELNALAEAMEGTVAQSIVDPENPKTALSVRAMLTANIGAMDLLPDQGPPFSIREWIERDGGGFLFLTSRADQHASLRGLISTWLEIAVNALLSLPREDARRIWLILDELPTLHQLPSLRPGLAESRQFGGCFVLGVQVFSALRELYGRDGAETISGLCGTRVVLAAPDKDTSEWSAESLGRVEVETLAEGVSYDTGEHPGAPRGGVTLSARRDLRPLVLPAEVARLENLTGYLKLPGPWPVARIALRYKPRPKVAKRFVARGEDEKDAGAAGRSPVRRQGSAEAGVEGGASSGQASCRVADGETGERKGEEWAAASEFDAASPEDAEHGASDEPEWLCEALEAERGVLDAAWEHRSSGGPGGDARGGVPDEGEAAVDGPQTAGDAGDAASGAKRESGSSGRGAVVPSEGGGAAGKQAAGPARSDVVRI